MNSYKYRWWYALSFNLILVIIFYYYNIHQDIFRLNVLKDHEKKLIEKLNQVHLPKPLAQKQRNQQWIYQTKTQTEVLADLVRIFTKCGLQIESIHFVPVRETDRFYAKVLMKGDYKQFLIFLYTSQRAENPLIIRNFSLQLYKTQLYLWIDLFVLKFKKATHYEDYFPQYAQMEFYNFQNPFCLSEQFFFTPQKTPSTLFSTSLHFMKLVGLITLPHQPLAVIKLPDDTLQSVSLGERIGLEKGVVSVIKEDHIIILLPDKKQKILLL